MRKLPKNNFLLLETNRFDKDNYCSYLFFSPEKIISCYKLKDVLPSLQKINNYLTLGYYAAGFMAYEAGYAFETNLACLKLNPSFPLLWFGIYKKPFILRHKDKARVINYRRAPYSIKNLRPNISEKEYIASVKKIKGFIRQGRTYQVNYTFKYKFDFSGHLFSLYEDLKEKQGVSYSAFIKAGDYSILSLSPELFFRKDKNRIEVRPMKGTLHRGRDLQGDKENIERLRNSIKDRSENIMIVDMLRNDIGRISRPGSVSTAKLFEVEQYETVLQMVSVIKSVLKGNVAVYDLFKAIFPSGSVTGAPKINTMKIIDSLEKDTRGIYTGAIGFFSPGEKAVFNVAIRTVLVNTKTKEGEMGIGSGIVYDSGPYNEFKECRLKADFITRETKPFELIETILYKKGKGYFLLKYHMDRLKSSACYFNFRYDRKKIMAELNKALLEFRKGIDYRVRLLLNREGGVKITFTAILVPLQKAKARFSDKKVSSEDIFLYHKTTNRALYNSEYKKYSGKGYFDIIFTNEKNQVTEGAVSNIVIKKGRIFWTPPVKCGILNGAFRRYLIDNKKIPVKEKILYKKDIYNADKLYMVNSVRGMVEGELD